MTFDDLDLAPSPLEQLRRKAALRSDYLDLSSSNPTHHGFVFPADILRACADAYWSSRRYEPNPKGSLRARESIARYYAQRTPPLQVSPEHIFITASTSEAYSLLFTLLAQPGDNVLAPVPSYPLFEHLGAMHHVSLLPYLLETSITASNWSFNLQQVAAQANIRTRALLLISPHNPTGHVLTADELAKPLGSPHASPDLHVPVIADEVFCEFPFVLDAVPPVGALFPRSTVFHLNGISKMFALPDMKLGWIAITGPEASLYLDRLELLNDTMLSANSLTQQMLPALFEHGMPFVNAMRTRIQYTLRQALTGLEAIGQVRVVAPLGGMYLFPEILGCDDEEALVSRLLAAGAFAHPGYFYDEERGCHLMLSGLLAPDRLLNGIDRLRLVLDTF
jgi:aspartate/methionine/tyrosine aminotransferase